MLVPLSWLREFTPYEGTAQQLGDRLTMLGLELEGIVNPFAGIKDIVVGFVASCMPHPDSDHMSVCKVDMGTGELVDIVCGAPNVAEGQKVAVAPVGARLPDGMTIKKAKLRGQPSNGMICSERELGLSEDHGGILILPESADVGHTLVEALSLDTEVLDISITPNRGDCLSVLGVARETAMAFGLPLHVPDLPVIPDDKASEMEVPIEIAEPDLCRMYCGRVVTGIKVAPAPLRMRYRLHAVGIRAISNIVDVTNYVLMECGQPLHSFDLDKLSGPFINVRRARAGEKFVTLDGQERVLNRQDLCICDAEKPVALAGVMGGLNSEITSESKNVFLESAVFQPQAIRKTSRRLGLVSEASYRFERGIDQQRSVWALDRACALIASISGGFPARGFNCAEPRPFRPCHIPYRPAKSGELLGVSLSAQFQEKVLTDVGCAVENAGFSEWQVIQPSWRHDLTREADLIEEVGRVYGLDTIAPTLPPVIHVSDSELFRKGQYGFLTLIRRWGAGLGLNEVINYSFTGQKKLDFLNLPEEGRIPIHNPLSEDQNVLRLSLTPGLLQDLANNLAFGNVSVRIFELANTFAKDAHSETNARETPMLGVLLAGNRHEHEWPHGDEEFGYSDIKGVLESLLHFLRLPQAKTVREEEHPYLLPCVQIICQEKVLGYMGRVMPAIARDYHAQKPVWMFEANLDILAELNSKANVSFKPLPVYPAVRRDITVIAPRSVQVEDILEKIFSVKIPILEGALLADCLDEGKPERNLTFRLTFRHASRTLKDAEVDKERGKVADYLCRELGVRI